MKKMTTVVTLALGVCVAMSASAGADEIGGFVMNFVPISGDASALNGTGWGPSGDTFSDPADFRMATYEVTNAQWDAFVAAEGVPTGTPAAAYNSNPTAGGPNKPVNNASFFEAAQFVNWLNTSTGNHVAYKFVETTPGDPTTLTFGVWDDPPEGDGTNLYRHKDAFYFLPTLHEVLKAAYWNGTSFNTYANATDTLPTPAEACFSAAGTWDVGSGAVELNGTYDIMGNIGEVQENDVNFLYPAATHMHRLGPGMYLVPSSFGAWAGWTGINNNQSAEVSYGGLRVAAAAAGMPGDFDGDGDVDADDVDLLCDNLGDVAYDLDGDGDADEDDMIFLIVTLVELQDGSGRVGTKRGDFNLDGFVDGTDLALMKTAFGQPLMDYADGNANCDAFVDGTDLAILKTNFGFIAPPSPGGVPEPASLTLLALGGLAALRRRRKQAY